MRVLIVEDDLETANDLEARLRRRLDPVEILRSESVADASEAIEAHTFDAAIVDLRLPEEPGGSTRLVEFGKLVDARIADCQPGAARVYLTASDLKEVKEQLRMSAPGDYFAIGDSISLVDHILKEGTAQLEECVEFVAAHRDRLVALDEVLLEGGDDIDHDDRRAFALTVRIAGGHSGRIAKRAGLSLCRTAVVECFDANGHSSGNAFCKVGPPDAIGQEQAGYDRVQFSLPSTARPTLDRELFVGIGRSRALVFTIAPTSSSLFDTTSDDVDTAEECVGALEELFRPWAPTPPTTSVAFVDLRRSWIKPEVEERFERELTSLGLERLEAEEYELLVHRQHGDLHGENILVVDHSSPFLIDFAYTDDLVGPVDPVSLELSFLFHEKSPLRGSLDGHDLNGWWDAAFLARTGGFGRFARVCRAWSEATGHDSRAYAVITLLYSLWILEHTTNHELALRIADVAMDALLA